MGKPDNILILYNAFISTDAGNFVF